MLRKTSLLAVLALVVLLTLLGWVGAKPAGGLGREADRAAIRDHIDRIFQAYMNKDESEIRATHAEGWIGFLSRSVTTMRNLDDYMEHASKTLSAPHRITNYEMREFEVRFLSDDHALVPYVADLLVDIGASEPVPVVLRTLDVYGRQEGEWIQVASHTTSHPETTRDRQRYLSQLSLAQRKTLFEARRAVWKAYFAGDAEALQRLLPEELIAVGAYSDQWANRADVIAASRAFAEAGGKLHRLEFPRTEVQLYGDVAILYTTYRTEVEKNGSRQVSTGRGTEIFILRPEGWVNSGWHLDSGPAGPPE